MRYIVVLVCIIAAGLGAVLGVLTNTPEPAKCPAPPAITYGVPPKPAPPVFKAWPDPPRLDDTPISLPSKARRPWNIFVGIGKIDGTFVEVSDSAVKLKMPEQSSWDCYLTALEAYPVGKPGALQPTFWVMRRDICCSNDLWVTNVRSSHAAFSSPDGKTENPQDLLTFELYEKDGEITVVALGPRTDKTDDRARKIFIRVP